MTRSVVAIGAFDGVHLGHQKVLDELKAVAAAHDAQPVVVTFEPLPRELLMGAEAPARIQPLRDRVISLRACGIDRVCCLRFTSALQHESAAAFVERVLQKRLQTLAVVAGADFRFGHRRAGDAETLRAAGVEFVEVSRFDQGGERVSSTRVRAALADADLELATGLLGRPYTVSGRVRRGDARGRELGFPTANLVPSRPLALADGVYAVTVSCWPSSLRGQRAAPTVHVGAAHWGTREWLGGTQRRIEVHLLDYSGDLYGQRLTVQFERFVRADSSFANLDAMKARIALDIDAVRDTIRARD